ncbi:MAG TPA: hypothetical protein GX693_03260, partial [Firmicutes bacterium]|nr:hypothetical protein [Bacillota bacterium]
MSVCTDHHRLYIGNPHSLEKQFFKHIAALKEDDPLSQVLVLVENNLAGIYLRRRLALLGDSHCRVVFLTISDLAYRLARSNPKAGQVKPLPRFTGDWLAAVTACRAETGYFGPLAHCPGFIQALKQLFQELMEAGLVKLPDIPGSDPLRLKELQRLYLYYRERLGSFLSPDLAYRLARQEGLPEGVHLIVYGCHGFSRRQRQFLQALFKKTQTTFYWQATALNLPAIQEVYSWLEVNRFTVHHLQAGAARGNLHILQQQLFNTFLEPVNPVSADQGVQLICSPDAVREVQEISRGIMARVR